MGYLVIILFILSFTQLAYSRESSEDDLSPNEEAFEFNGNHLEFSVTQNSYIADSEADLFLTSIKDNFKECAIECYNQIAECSIFQFDSTATTTSNCLIYSGSNFTIMYAADQVVGFYLGII